MLEPIYTEANWKLVCYLFAGRVLPKDSLVCAWPGSPGLKKLRKHNKYLYEVILKNSITTFYREV